VASSANGRTCRSCRSCRRIQIRLRRRSRDASGLSTRASSVCQAAGWPRGRGHSSRATVGSVVLRNRDCPHSPILPSKDSAQEFDLGAARCGMSKHLAPFVNQGRAIKRQKCCQRVCVMWCVHDADLSMKTLSGSADRPRGTSNALRAREIKSYSKSKLSRVTFFGAVCFCLTYMFSCDIVLHI
jgi:hypothetical protein